MDLLPTPPDRALRRSRRVRLAFAVTRFAITRRVVTVTCGGFAVPKRGLAVVQRVHTVTGSLSRLVGLRIDAVVAVQLVAHTGDEVATARGLIAPLGEFVALTREPVADLGLTPLVGGSVLRLSLHAADFMRMLGRRRRGAA
jgi:hypothetical protein